LTKIDKIFKYRYNLHKEMQQCNNATMQQCNNAGMLECRNAGMEESVMWIAAALFSNNENYLRITDTQL